MFRKCLNLSSTQTHHIPSCYISRTNKSFRKSKNHYDVLGLTPKATQNDIKAAYYKLSMQFHPDKNKGSDDVVQKFRDITAAYEVLGTYRLRKLYDKGIHQPNLGPIHTQEPEFKNPQDVQPDDDAQTKFYKSRFKRSEVPNREAGGAPIYDFDTWSREHYGSTLDRSQKAKKKYEKKISNTGISLGYSHMEILLFGSIVLCILVLFAKYDGSQYDKVKEKPDETPEK